MSDLGVLRDKRASLALKYPKEREDMWLAKLDNANHLIVCLKSELEKARLNVRGLESRIKQVEMEKEFYSKELEKHE